MIELIGVLSNVPKILDASLREALSSKIRRVVEFSREPGSLNASSAFLFAENNRFPVDVIALEECEIILIPKNAVMRLLATNEHFLQSYMAFNANRTQFLSERLQLLSIKTIKGKLAYYILKRIQGDHYKQDRNQTELSEYFGVARPSLARSFSEMIEEGAISREGKIVDMNKLKSYVL